MLLSILLNKTTPIDFLRDPVWTFIGVVFSLIAIFVTIGIYLKQQTRKEITYRVLESNFLYLSLKIWNSGNLAIKIDDYENKEPIRIVFEKGAEVVKVKLGKTKPKNLNISIQSNDNEVLVDPFLLNPKESIILEIATTSNDFDLIARIADIRVKKHRISYMIISSLIALIIGLILAFGFGLISIMLALSKISILLGIFAVLLLPTAIYLFTIATKFIVKAEIIVALIYLIISLFLILSFIALNIIFKQIDFKYGLIFTLGVTTIFILLASGVKFLIASKMIEFYIFFFVALTTIYSLVFIIFKIYFLTLLLCVPILALITFILFVRLVSPTKTTSTSFTPPSTPLSTSSDLYLCPHCNREQPNHRFCSLCGGAIS